MPKSKFLRGRTDVRLLNGKWKYNSKLNRFSKFRNAKLVNNVNNYSSTPNNDLIIVKGCSEGGRPLRILIDHASQAELISEAAASQLNKNIISSDVKLVTAQGASLNVSGQVNLDLCIGGHKSYVAAQVVNQLSSAYDMIIGIGWLNQHDTNLRTKVGHTPIFLHR